MKGYLFIYTRLDKFDYRLLYAPDIKILPSPIRDTFINFAREVINTDNIGNGPITSERWAMIKRDNLHLVGVGCYNNLLGHVESANEKRVVRGFFGLVFDSYSQALSNKIFELDLYKDIFVNYVLPFWNLPKKDEYRTNSIIQEIDIEACEKQDRGLISINDSPNICRVHSNMSSPYELFTSALSIKDADFVCNLNNSEHVLSHSLYAFKNITIVDNVSSFDISLIPIFRNDREKTQNGEKVHKNGRYTRRSLSRKDGELAEIADVIYQKIKRCGISTIDFLKALSSRFGYTSQFVRDDSHEEDDISIHASGDNSISQVDLKDEGASMSINEYNQGKQERKDCISSLQKQFNAGEPVKLSPPSSLEEIADKDIGGTSVSPANTIETLDDIIKNSKIK